MNTEPPSLTEGMFQFGVSSSSFAQSVEKNQLSFTGHDGAGGPELAAAPLG